MIDLVLSIFGIVVILTFLSLCYSLIWICKEDPTNDQDTAATDVVAAQYIYTNL
jgi:hypothetical protein